jgi:murein DD-endopeptidase MepM/ murein hydrolase activator NlpD
VSGAHRRRLSVLAAVLLAALALPVPAPADPLRVVWRPSTPRPGDVVWVEIAGVGEAATVEGSLGARALTFFPHAGGQAAVLGLDVDEKPGTAPWRVTVVDGGRTPRTARGDLRIATRKFKVQHLTLPTGMVDLDPETERRALEEGERLRTLFRTTTPVRLWHGRFTRPVAGAEPGTGYGARRIINGQPRAPHTGIDYAVERGTPVVAVNGGRVALVADYFFPGRLVIVDHGLGVYTLYFHLDTVGVTDGEMVERGQPLGTVGATGRATGPHLHFGAHVGGARVDPASLLGLAVRD